FEIAHHQPRGGRARHRRSLARDRARPRRRHPRGGDLQRVLAFDRGLSAAARRRLRRGAAAHEPRSRPLERQSGATRISVRRGVAERPRMIGLSSEDRRDLVRWIACGAIVGLVHAGVAAAMMRWHDLAEAADPAAAIVIELAALPVAPAAEPTDLPVGPEQDQADAQPEEKVVEKPEEQVVDKPIEQLAENTPQKTQEPVEETQ